MTSPLFIGIDLNVRVLALAIVRDGVYQSSFAYSDPGSLVAYMRSRRDEIALVMIERPPAGSPKYSGILGHRDALVRDLTSDRIALLLVPDTEWKKALLAKGDATKSAINTFAKETLGIELRPERQHETDAACIGLYASRRYAPRPKSKRAKPDIRLQADDPELWKYWPAMARSGTYDPLYVELVRQSSPHESKWGIKATSTYVGISSNSFNARIEGLEARGLLRRVDNTITLLSPRSLALTGSTDTSTLGLGNKEVEGGEAQGPSLVEVIEQLTNLYVKWSRVPGSGPAFGGKDRERLQDMLDNGRNSHVIHRFWERLVRIEYEGAGFIGRTLAPDSWLGDDDAALIDRVEESVKKYGATLTNLAVQWNALNKLDVLLTRAKLRRDRLRREEEVHRRIKRLAVRRLEAGRPPQPEVVLLRYLQRRLGSGAQDLFRLKLDAVEGGCSDSDVLRTLGYELPANDSMQSYDEACARPWRRVFSFDIKRSATDERVMLSLKDQDFLSLQVRKALKGSRLDADSVERRVDRLLAKPGEFEDKSIARAVQLHLNAL